MLKGLLLFEQMARCTNNHWHDVGIIRLLWLFGDTDIMIVTLGYN